MEFGSLTIPWNVIFSIFSGSAVFATVALFFLIAKAKGKLALQDTHCTADTISYHPVGKEAGLRTR